MGIMEEIKGHLESGKTVKELKELGFKAPSIYKVKKQMKDDEIGDKIKTPPIKENIEPFQKNEEVPEEILDSTPKVGDHNPIGLNNPDPDPDNILDNSKTEGEEKDEPLIEELFGDDDQPFQDFDEVNINRNHVDINTPGGIHKPETKIANTGTGKLGTAELITQIYSLIGITTGHEHWNVTSKEQKVLKHLCKIPALEAALHRFGLYGCVISVITMTLKRIKIEMQIKNTTVKKEDQRITPEPVVRPDSPATVMGLLDQ